MVARFLTSLLSWVTDPFERLNSWPVVVQYNVTGPAGVEAHSRQILLPHSCHHVIPLDAHRPVTLSLRSWPLGSLEAFFPHEPTDEELIEALLVGWQNYVEAPSEDRELVMLAARASAWRMW